MKIVQHTSTVLTLKNRPVVLWLFGGVFAVAGLLVIIFVGRAATLACRRVEPTQINCELAESGLLGAQFRKVTGLSGAEVETNTSGDGDTYRVALFTREGKIPLTSIYSSGFEGKQEKVSRIDSFAGNPGKISLKVEDGSRWFAYPFGGVFITVGLMLVGSMGQVVTCTFDKVPGRMILKRQGLFGTEVFEHSLREILNVQVEESTDSDGSTYRVECALVSGDRLPLTSYYSSGKKSHQQAVDCIQTFLKG